MAPKKANVPSKAKKEDDFDALLSQLAVATAAKGKDVGQEKHLTAAERKEAHKKRHANELKAKEDAIAKSIQQRAQQKQLQDMIRDFIARGGSMGQSPFLDTPKTDVETISCAAKSPSRLLASAASMQGWRRAMEDEHIMLPNFRKGGKGADDIHLFAVMDGHGGTTAAAKTKIVLPAALSRELDKAGDIPTQDAFTAAFKAVDTALLKLGDDVMTCGCTCTAVLITSQAVYCASVGDSRAVLARKVGQENDVVALSFDHKPECEGEKKRIEATGGHVANNRVNGNLAMSRALGDFTYKQTKGKSDEEQQVICVPDVHSCARKADDEFLVVACDGIFDVFTNEELVKTIRAEIGRLNLPVGSRLNAQQLEYVAANITRLALAPAADGEQAGPSRAEGTDNMSIIIVQF